MIIYDRRLDLALAPRWIDQSHAGGAATADAPGKLPGPAAGMATCMHLRLRLRTPLLRIADGWKCEICLPIMPVLVCRRRRS